MKSILASFLFDSSPYQPPSVSLTSDTLVHGRLSAVLKLRTIKATRAVERSTILSLERVRL